MVFSGFSKEHKDMIAELTGGDMTIYKQVEATCKECEHFDSVNYLCLNPKHCVRGQEKLND